MYGDLDQRNRSLLLGIRERFFSKSERAIIITSMVRATKSECATATFRGALRDSYRITLFGSCWRDPQHHISARIGHEPAICREIAIRTTRRGALVGEQASPPRSIQHFLP